MPQPEKSAAFHKRGFLRGITGIGRLPPLKSINGEEEIWQERALALYPANRFKEILLR
jgi:hypothetical protein